MKITLYIRDNSGNRTVTVEDELTVGRTELSQIILDDQGLSRKNTTFFIDDGAAYVVDERSLNGTTLNGRRIDGPPERLYDGDLIKIGSSTEIRVEIGSGTSAAKRDENKPPAAAPQIDIRTGKPIPKTAKAKAASSSSNKAKQSTSSLVWAAAILMSVAVIMLGITAYIFLVPTPDPAKPPEPQTSTSAIPMRVIDPLGSEDINDINDLIASWEVQEDELNTGTVEDLAVQSEDEQILELNVTAAFIAERQRLAMENRPGEKGIRPAGLNVPPELRGDGVIKQKAKLLEMKEKGYQQPLDFAELAEKRLSGELIEMPAAKESYYLDVGGSAQDIPFKFYSFSEKAADIAVGSPKYGILSRLAGNFGGQAYDLNNAAHRKQMRMRLLRMFNKRARPILLELADAYHQKFGRPLRVTSLTRSMDYQVLLNSNNANSFVVRGEGSLPPHTSGCAFDLARKHMPVEEQNFVMAKLASMEREGRLDGLIEYGANACFHVFIYDDGVPPKMGRK